MIRALTDSSQDDIICLRMSGWSRDFPHPMCCDPCVTPVTRRDTVHDRGGPGHDRSMDHLQHLTSISKSGGSYLNTTL